MARTARREVIGLLVEKQVAYTDAEADALIAEAKRQSKESGRTVRAEAELLLSRDRASRLRELRSSVLDASRLLAAVAVEFDDLLADPGGEVDDQEVAVLMATMTASCAPFASGQTTHPPPTTPGSGSQVASGAATPPSLGGDEDGLS